MVGELNPNEADVVTCCNSKCSLKGTFFIETIIITFISYFVIGFVQILSLCFLSLYSKSVR